MLSLTRQEKLLLIFLTSLLLLGLILNYALKTRPVLHNFYQYSGTKMHNDYLSVNINSASVQELVRLPGVGEIIASRIIKYRRLHGDFKEKGELKNIKGIGEKKFQDINEHITIK